MPPQVIPLWPGGEIDTTVGRHPEEVTSLPDGVKVIRNVTIPTLTAYLPDPSIATGTAVIVCPGGAYHYLAFEYEGTQVAEWLNKRGIAAFLLKYRLIQTGENFPQCVWDAMADREKMMAQVAPLFPQITADGCQAVRLVRSRAAEWGITADHIGIMGFSAGGAVTLSTALHFDPDSRPNFAAPIYSAPPPDAPIPADAPPLFLLCAADDEMASAVSTRCYTAWRAAGHLVELHIYAKGGHGFGMNQQGLPSDRWIERFADWLQAQGFLP
jgi:acetyl esterase/lipase